MSKADSSSDPIVIIGGGQAAVQLCLALRKEKVLTPILMLSEESEYPYHRPPLSKSFLTGETSDEKLAMRPVSFYESKQVQVELNCTVTGIDTTQCMVTTSSGDFAYASLIIATGARPRSLPVPGMQLSGVHLLRDIQQSRSIKKELESAQNIVVIGAGFIGLEFAAVANSHPCSTASSQGRSVTVFDMGDRVMARSVAPLVSAWFEKTHRANGIAMRLTDSVTQLIGDTQIKSVVTAAGEELDCDLLLAGIGVVPNQELAVDAGIDCENGIVVNEFCETSANNVYAVGDCAYHPNPFYNHQMIRLESVQNATDQARVVAKHIAGLKQPYHSVPWFWSDQGEHSLQMVGLSDKADQFVQRAGEAPDSFSVFHFAGATLKSVDSVNCPRDHMLARKLIAQQISPTPEQVADTGFDLKSLLP